MLRLRACVPRTVNLAFTHVLSSDYYGHMLMNRLGLGENGKGGASEYGQGRGADVVVEGPRRGGDRERTCRGTFGTQGASGHQ